MKINQATIALLALSLCTLAPACHRNAPPAQTPGRLHTELPSAAPGGRLSVRSAAAAPSPDYWWLEGCWYWNGGEWEWLAQKWMPPGGRMDYVGPQYSRDDYCVYTPPQQQFVSSVMVWPPDVSYGQSTVYVVQHGEYGTRRQRRRPNDDFRAPARDHFYDHRTPRPRPEHPDPPEQRWPDRIPVVEIGPAARPERPQPPRTRPEIPGRIAPGNRVGPAHRQPSPSRHQPTSRPRPPVMAPPSSRPPSSRPPSRPQVGPRIQRPGPSRAAPKPAGSSRPVHRPTPPRSAPPKRSAPPPRAAPPKRSAPPPRAAPPKRSAPPPRSAGARKR